MSKTVLITGANRGLGKELYSVFADNGFSVVGHAGKKQGDLKLPATVKQLQVIAEKTNVDILINNAGIYTNKFFPNMSIAEYEDIILTNLLAPIMLTKVIWPIFQKKKSGIVVFINSVAGKIGSPGESAYCASKFGLKGFTDSLQYDAIRANVKVLSVFLGAMYTDMTKGRGGSREAYIDPADAALMIFDATKEYPGGEQTELVIDRISKKGQ